MAHQSLDSFSSVLQMLTAMEIDVSEWRKRLEECELMYAEGTIFAYMDLLKPASDGRNQALQAAIKILDDRIRINRTNLGKAQTDAAQEVSKASDPVNRVEREASEKERSFKGGFSGGSCLLLILIVIFVFVSFLYSVAVDLDQRAHQQGYVWLTVALLTLAGFIFLRKPILKYFQATSPALTIRSQLPELNRQLERVKTECRERLVRETAVLDQGLERLKRQKEECQKALTA